MAGLGQNREESIGSQRQDRFLNLERRRDREVSVHTTHTSRSQSQGESHISHEENIKSLQPEIDRLRRRLRRKRWRRIPSDFDPCFKDKKDGNYRPRSRTPPNESFSCDEDHHYERRSKILPHKCLGNDAMSRALNQISKSLFTRRIERGKFPQHFTQPTFTI